MMNKAHSTCLDNICESCFERHQAWTHLAGKVAAWKDAIAEVEQAAATAFILKKDAEANNLRQLADRFRLKLLPLSDELQRYINSRE